MTKTNTLRSAILIAFTLTGTAAYAAGPIASGAADVGIDTGANARLSAPAQINKPIGAPNTLNSATPAVPSVAPGVPAVPAVPGNPIATERVLEQRPDRLDTTTSAQGNAQSNTEMGASVTGPTGPAASSSMGASGSTTTNAGVGSSTTTTGASGSAGAAASVNTGSGDSLVIREELDAKGNLNAAAATDDGEVKTKAKTQAKKSNRNKVSSQRKTKPAVQTN